MDGKSPMPHSREVEEAAMRVIDAAVYYATTDPAKFAAACRVINRNTTARTEMYGELLRAVS